MTDRITKELIKDAHDTLENHLAEPNENWLGTLSKQQWEYIISLLSDPRPTWGDMKTADMITWLDNAPFLMGKLTDQDKIVRENIILALLDQPAPPTGEEVKEAVELLKEELSALAMYRGAKTERALAALSVLSSLAEENERLGAEVERCYGLLMGARCVYCGWKASPDTPNQDIADETLRQHILLCEKHPVNVLSKENAALKGEVERLKKVEADFAQAIRESGHYREQKARAEKAEAELDALEGAVSRLCDYEFGQDEEWLDGALISKAQANGRAREGKEPK